MKNQPVVGKLGQTATPVVEGSPLGAVDMELASAEGAWRLLPNDAAMFVASKDFPFGAPKADVLSELTGAPAYVYRTSEATLRLTRQEVERLWMHNLTVEEFRKLYATHGAIYELHDDFYDPDTGEALQPMEL